MSSGWASIGLSRSCRHRASLKAGKQIAAHGHAVTRWTQPNGLKHAWLKKSEVRGQWIETEHMPDFDKQHPELYALAVSELTTEPELA